MRQFQICPSCYQRNPVNAEKCGNCALPLDATSELLTDLPQPDKRDQQKPPTTVSTISPETSNKIANNFASNNKEEGQESAPQAEPQSAIPPTPEIKNPESIDPAKEIKDRSREDLDWLKMLDLDRDILANQPARSIRSESLTPTDWINTLIPQSDELPKLPETGALQNSVAEEDGDSLNRFEPESSDNNNDDLNVLDILLNDPTEADEGHRSVDDAGAQWGANTQPPISRVDVDPTPKPEERLVDIDQLPAEDPLNSWLSDIAADFELLTDPSPTPVGRLEEASDLIVPTEAAETAAGLEAPTLDADAATEMHAAHIGKTDIADIVKAVPEPERYHRGFTGDLIERVEEELESQSLKSELEPEKSRVSSAAAEQERDVPVDHSSSDETLAAWLAELETDTANQGESAEQVEWLDSIEAKPDSENDKLPDWLHEHGQADLSPSATNDTLDTETFDDDALEWLIPANELTPKVDAVDSMGSTVDPNETLIPASIESEREPADPLSLNIAEGFSADVETDPLPHGTIEPKVEEIESDTAPAAETATMSDIESMLDDLLDLPPSHAAEAQETATLSPSVTDQPIFQDEPTTQVEPQAKRETAEAEPETDWLDLNWEESAAPFADTRNEAEIPTLPAEPIEPPAEIAEMFDEFLAIEEDANMAGRGPTF